MDGTATAGVSEDGATGGAVPDWTLEAFSMTSGSASTLSLTYVPIEYTERVRLNGVMLAPGVDYTISESTLTWLDLASLRLGIGSDTWDVEVQYAYTETAEVPFEARDFLSWTLNGTATIVGGTEIRLTAASASQKGSIVCPDVIPSGWDEVIIDVTTYTSAVNGDGFECILWDAAQHTTAELDVNGKTYFSATVLQTPPAVNKQFWLSNDGTTTISNSVSGNQLGVFEQDDSFRWTRTGPTTATVTHYRGGVLVGTAPADLWTPSTVYVGLCAYTGGLFYNEHTVRAATITVT